MKLLPPGRKYVQRQVNDRQIHDYVADGELDGEPEAEAEGDGDADGEPEAEAEGEVEAEGELDAEAEGDVDGELDAEAEAITVPRFPSSASQRYTPPLPPVGGVTVTDTSERKSLASAKMACVSPATLKPPVAVTVMSPPPSTLIRRTKRIPAFVGLGSVRVSPEAPEVISQINRSALGRMIPALPGSFRR